MKDTLQNYDGSFSALSSGEVLNRHIIEKNKYHGKSSAYKVVCRFKSEFHNTSFIFEKVAYDRDEDGFWRFQPHLATQENFAKWRKETMPDDYAREAERQFGQECLVYQLKNFTNFDNSRGYENEKQTMEALQRFERSQRLDKVLQMLPIVDMQLNQRQVSILNSVENLFILGRSGTGKTTTTVLRFFCQEAMYLAMRKQNRLLNAYRRQGMLKKYNE